MKSIMNNYNQLVVWQACVVGPDKIQEFQEMMEGDGFRCKYAGEFETLPDEGDPNSGGRNDLLFYIHDDDIPKFSIWRLQHGMRWWEDVLGNGHGNIIPAHILEKYKNAWEEA